MQNKPTTRLIGDVTFHAAQHAVRAVEAGATR